VSNLPRPFAVALATGAVLWLSQAGDSRAEPVPDPIRAMIITAARSNDPTVFAAVVAVAKQAAPGSAEEIEALSREIPKDIAAIVRAEAGDLTTEPDIILVTPLPARRSPWKGAAELGGSRATGETDTLGVYGSVNLSRIGPAWTHRVSGRFDYQDTNGVRSIERYGAGYEPQVRLNERLYSFGVAQYEHDRFLGYQDRVTVGVGFGVNPIDRPDFKVSLDAGPAFRSTDYIDQNRQATIAGRGSLNARWLPSERITVSQEGAVYLETGQTTAKSTTAVETLLFGPLKARFSYNVQFERDRRISRENLNTTTRASLLYSF
jgi:putative salt-induced outer membrane protein